MGQRNCDIFQVADGGKEQGTVAIGLRKIVICTLPRSGGDNGWQACEVVTYERTFSATVAHIDSHPLPTLN